MHRGSPQNTHPNLSIFSSSVHVHSGQKCDRFTQLHAVLQQLASRAFYLPAQMLDTMQDTGFSYEQFLQCIKEIVAISDNIHDGWQLESKDNGHYLTKKCSQMFDESEQMARAIIIFEYHVAFNISYGVPVLCFVAWKQDGSYVQLEEYCSYNRNFSNSDILSTLTQLDHPVLCKPFLTLHPCRTQDILNSFHGKSKNLVISWLSVISPFLNLKLDEEYIKAC